METITRDEISNCELASQVQNGDIVGKHKYEGGQVDWYVIIDGETWAWFGGNYSIPIPSDEDEVESINIISEYEVI